MIRRLLVFVILIVLGFSVLWMALGRDAFTAKRSAQLQTQPSSRRPAAAAGGIDVQPEREGAPRLTFSIEGEFEVQPTREVALADGSKLLLPTYRLHADDTRPRPEADNLMEMRGVTVELFRLLRDGIEPRTEKSGELRAQTVLVEIERDAHGRPSIHQDREMDFRDAVFRTLPAAGVTEMTLRVGRARLRTTEGEAVLRTAEREPFTLDLAGAQSATVTGKGLFATIPTGDTPGPIDVRVLAEPQMVTSDGKSKLSARGELHFTEDPAAVGRMEMRDGVEVTFASARDRTPLTARGDVLRAGLRRVRGAGKADALWEWIVLDGAPATVDAGQATIQCQRLDVLPSTNGGAGLLTASGAPCQVELAPPGGQPTTLSSERRVHMLPLADSLHEWIGPLGFPKGSLGPRFGQIIVFAGHSTAATQQASGRLDLDAADGLVVLRGTRADGMTTVRGLGAVVAKLPGDDVTLRGDDGMVLHDLPTADGRSAKLILGTGRAAAPLFELHRGADMHLQGHGHLQLEQTTRGARQVADVDMTSPAEDGLLRVPQGTLSAIGRLQVELRDGAISALEASGTRCLVDASLHDGAVACEAKTVHSDDGRSFRLRGSPAKVVDARRGTVLGDVVDLMSFGDESGLRARGNARVQGRIARAGGDAIDVDLRGEVAEMMPWRVPPRALRWHGSFLPPAAATVCAATWRAPHVHVRADVTSTLTDPADPDGKNEGQGDELWLQIEDQGGGRGLLLGQPAHVRVHAKDQAAEGEAEAISFRQVEGKMLVTLMPADGRESSMHLVAAEDERVGHGNAIGVRDLTVYCHGQIRIEERVIRFLGPVRVLGDENADAEPTLAVTANGMVMRRDSTGAVTDIVAEDDVVLTSPRVRGHGDALTLDVKRATAMLRSRRGVASIVVDGGHAFTCSQVEFDYTTYTVRAWYGDIRPREGR